MINKEEKSAFDSHPSQVVDDGVKALLPEIILSNERKESLQKEIKGLVNHLLEEPRYSFKNFFKK